MVCMVSGINFRDGMLAHWITHSVGVSLRTPGYCCNAVPSKECGVCCEGCPMLGFCTEIKTIFWVFSSNGSVFSVCVFGQLCSSSNVCGAWTHVCIHKAHFPSSTTRHILSSLHCGSRCGSVVKLNTFYLHQTPS